MLNKKNKRFYIQKFKVKHIVREDVFLQMLYSDSKTADSLNSKCIKQIEHVKTGVRRTNVYL